MNRILASVVVALAIAVAALSAYMVAGGEGKAEADFPIDCTVNVDTSTDPPTGTITCAGGISIPAEPGGILDLLDGVEDGQYTFTFDFAINFQDLPPAGPSFEDVIGACSIDIAGDVGGWMSLDYGPCPAAPSTPWIPPDFTMPTPPSGFPPPTLP